MSTLIFFLHLAHYNYGKDLEEVEEQKKNNKEILMNLLFDYFYNFGITGRLDRWIKKIK